MDAALITRAIELLERANSDLDPEALSVAQAREQLHEYTRAQRLAAFGVAALARRVDDVTQVSKAAGTSIGKAKETLATGKVALQSDVLSNALQQGDISLDQAAEIAKAEESAPGAATELVTVAKEEPFHVLKERARKTKLEAEQHRGLAERQRAARSARSHVDDLGMVNLHLRLQPHIGTPIVARAEAEAERLLREAKRQERELEPFERYLADAYAALLQGAGKGRARRPELVVLVSHEVAKRGWKDVKESEHCRIPGVGPIAPEVARDIAKDAFVNGVLFDGKDLRHFKRWGRHIPPEILLALELGAPPAFDGVRCVDCGHRFRPEIDHVRPRFARGPTSKPNLDWRCWTCHQEKTKRERAAEAPRAARGRPAPRFANSCTGRARPRSRARAHARKRPDP